MKKHFTAILLCCVALATGAAFANPTPPPGVPNGGQFFYMDADGNVFICTNANGQARNCIKLTDSAPPLEP